LFRASSLREVARERGHRLPGTPGEYYSSDSLTEDDEITLALKLSATGASRSQAAELSPN
jgi:hypothetical protein